MMIQISKVTIRGTSFFLLISLFLSCNHDLRQDVQHILGPNLIDWHSIKNYNDEMIVYGGDNWQHASVLKLKADHSYELYESNSELGSLLTDIICEDQLLMYGLYGTAATVIKDTIEFHRFNYWNNINAACKISEDEYLITANSDKTTNNICKLSCESWWDFSECWVIESTAFKDMVRLSDHSIMACGYGFITQSYDDGITWKISSSTDGNFIDLELYQNSVYILSQKGKVLKYDIDDQKFTTIRKVNSRFSSIRSFKTIHIDKEGSIFLGAEEGNLLIKEENEWRHMKIDYDQQINAIYSDGVTVYIAGNNGFLSYFKL